MNILLVNQQLAVLSHKKWFSVSSQSKTEAKTEKSAFFNILLTNKVVVSTEAHINDVTLSDVARMIHAEHWLSS